MRLAKKIVYLMKSMLCLLLGYSFTYNEIYVQENAAQMAHTENSFCLDTFPNVSQNSYTGNEKTKTYRNVNGESIFACTVLEMFSQIKFSNNFFFFGDVLIHAKYYNFLHCK